MPSDNAAPSDTPSVVLDSTLDLKAAGPLMREILAARGQGLVVDASEVRRLGGQCLQVLLAARAAWASDGHAFELRDPSPAFIEGAALMGAADRFGLASQQEPTP